MEIKNFDATNIAPQQMGDRHPVGMFPAQITNTYGKANKNSDGGQFVVEFSTPAGMVANRYNLWNKEPKAVEIAQKELSALCHAVGVFKLSFENMPENSYGQELRNARCSIKVDLQDASKPDGYIEIKKIFDINGNEPGKGPAPGPAPQQQQGNGGWSTGGNTQQTAPANNGGWGTNPNPNPNPSGQQQSGNAGGPPWAR